MFSQIVKIAICILAACAALAAGTRRAGAGHTAFALVVTNNHGEALGRPDLQYADDDGARYYELFQTFAPADHVTLLTDFDRDTARLFPQLVPLAQPPTRANVAAAAAAIAARAAAAERAGDSVDFYFVFAGHGDVDRGRGFLELADGEFDGAGLEALIAQIRPTHAHVILDSCNSFFVVNARRPGGRRFATPVDAAAGIAAHLPNVGVFVSTSAEAEVFEWSELQSGVFSHAVRSGLAGAADANGDGIVSYDELRAFVDTATADVKNAAFRPKVYARGPGGDDRAALAPLAIAGQRLALDPARAVRLAIRDRDELTWIDLYKEAGAPLALRLPPALAAAGASADELAGDRVLVRHALPADPAAVVALADAPVTPAPPLASRGPDDVFRAMFTRPFGPAALARYDAELDAAPPPVFGVSRDDVARLSELLGEVDDSERETRRLSAASAIAIGAADVAYSSLASGWSASSRIAGASAGIALTAYATYRMVHAGSGEHMRATLAAGLASGRDPAAVVAEADAEIHAAARAAHHGRVVQGWLAAALLATSGTLFAIDRADGRPWSKNQPEFDALLAASGTVGGLGLLLSFVESPIERTTRIWDLEPALATPTHLSIAPVTGGAALSLGGSF